MQGQRSKIFAGLTKSLIAIFFLFLLAASSSGQEWKNKYNDYDQVREKFSNPPMWYAPHTFWFWDAPLDPDLAAAMAREMTKQRLNPGYAHPRHSGAPNKPYPKLPVEQWLSPLWFESFAAALAEAEKTGMTLGYCDEYWWPSGQAAGRVLKAHPELAAQSLDWSRQEIVGPATIDLPRCKFTVAGRLSEQNLLDANTLTVIGESNAFSWQVPQGRWAIYSYTLYHHPGVDGGKVNYLDSRLMDVFISIAHEPYQRAFNDKMGASIPGVFVDNEGDYGWKLAWSDYLVERYQELKDRDVRVWLPLLAEKDDQGLWAKARFDWFDVVSDVYCSQFLGKLVKWLNQRNMYYISNLWEETLMLQTRAVGDFMRAQRTVTMPGNDCLEMKSQQVHDFKETQSVCEFEDRPFMSEIMGVAGWEQTPVQMKMTINATTAWGVTHAVPHGINLNRKLETIPYPADWFSENPYWRYLHLWTDFARRAAFVNRQGKLVADVLLVNPLTSVWALSEGYFTSEDGNRWGDQVIEINEVYTAAMNALTDARVDYLIADRHYLQNAEVVAASKSNTVTRLRIGHHSFSAIVLPPMVIASRTTVQRISDFAQAGGIVVLLGETPHGSPEKGAHDLQIVDQMRQLKNLPNVINLAQASDITEVLPEAIRENIHPQFRMLSGEVAPLISHRQIGDADFYWLANNKNLRQNCTLYFRDGHGRAEVWDCETGLVSPIYYQQRQDGCIIDLDLQPYQAFWLVFNAGESPIEETKQKSLRKEEIKITGPWKLSLAEAKQVQVSAAKTLVSLSDQIQPQFLQADVDGDWQMQKIVGYIRFVDQWRASLLYNPDPNSQRFYRYNFVLTSRPQAAVINVNADNSARLWVNGEAIPAGDNADNLSEIDVYDIGAHLRQGKNVIVAQTTNQPGFGWLIVQGVVQKSDGASFEILTNTDWKESKTEVSGWQDLGFDDSSWSSAILAPESLQQQERRSMRNPQKVLQQRGSIWWQLPVPPGATALSLPGLSAAAKIWVDGNPKVLKNGRIKLSKDSKLVVIDIHAGESGLSAPAVFQCQGWSDHPLGSWLDLGLQRFTGFVDYENAFTIPDKAAKVTLDLGKVQHTCEVWVNGEKAGERLWPPFSFDISPYIRSGENKLRVRVGNLMVNEMGLKDDLGQLRLWGWRGNPSIEEFDAGLFGPVKIMVGEKR